MQQLLKRNIQRRLFQKQSLLKKVAVPAEAPAPSSMDIQAMKQGDFRSVAGTWRNSAGWEFHIDKDGNITSGGKTF